MTIVEVRKYRDPSGRIPFDDWFNDLGDRRAKGLIQIRIDRLNMGLEGDWKSVGEGVRELRISEGAGYRIYYAWEGEAVVLLLCGGDKASQERDIEVAQRQWRQYRGQ